MKLPEAVGKRAHEKMKSTVRGKGDKCWFPILILVIYVISQWEGILLTIK